jgi:hypothetical protein
MGIPEHFFDHMEAYQVSYVKSKGLRRCGFAATALTHPSLGFSTVLGPYIHVSLSHFVEQNNFPM